MSANTSSPLSDIPPHLRPHVHYAGACLGTKLLFGSLFKYVAIHCVSLVNFWYPLVATLVCVHELRHPNPNTEKEQQARAMIEEKLSASWDEDDGTPTKAESGEDAYETRDKAASACNFWFQYWSIYALTQTLDLILVSISLVVFRDHTRINQFMAEILLFFSVYLFFMKTPLAVCYNYVKPRIIQFHLKLTEVVPEESWNSAFSSKAEQLLELMVTIHLIQRPWKDKAVVILRELRPLVVPAVLTLLPITPTMFTRMGVIYSQYLLPVGKSSVALHNQSQKLHYLQYWILHSCFAIFFEGLSMFWWLPFFDHSMFLFWAYLALDGTISEYYNVLEIDLISLGILHGESKIELHQTQTVQFLTAIAKRLPGADEAARDALLEDKSSDDDKQDNNHTVAQLKNLIRQLPKNDKDLNLPDEKTTRILEMLIYQLSREEEKIVQKIEERVSSNSPTSDQWVDIAYDSDSEINLSKVMSIDQKGDKSVDTVVTDDDEFYNAAKENNNTNTSQRRAASESKSEENFYDAKMQGRRLKRERASNSSFVSRLIGRRDSNQRTKRKEKREKAKEKKREKRKKNI